MGDAASRVAARALLLATAGPKMPLSDVTAALEPAPEPTELLELQEGYAAAAAARRLENQTWAAEEILTVPALAEWAASADAPGTSGEGGADARMRLCGWAAHEFCVYQNADEFDSMFYAQNSHDASTLIRPIRAPIGCTDHATGSSVGALNLTKSESESPSMGCPAPSNNVLCQLYFTTCTAPKRRQRVPRATVLKTNAVKRRHSTHPYSPAIAAPVNPDASRVTVPALWKDAPRAPRLRA